jgi:hypothetical protein
LNTPRLEEQVAFYEKYFSFRRKQHGKGWFLWNPHGFLMAVNPIDELPEMPKWFHIGFRFETKAEVLSLHSELRKDRFDIPEIYDDADYMQFRFPDPSGYVVEIFWEPPPNF